MLQPPAPLRLLLGPVLLLALSALPTSLREEPVRASAPRPAAQIYWGAWMDGEPYSHGKPRSWTDAPWDRRTWARFERHAGKRVSIVHLGQPAPWARPFDRIPLALTRRRGAIPLVDMNTTEADRRSGRRFTLGQIGSGARDGYLRRWAQAAARYGWPFFLRLNWEMNGDWFAWGREAKRRPRAFVAAWRRFHDIAEAAGARNVTWVWCPNVSYRGSTPLGALYPGDAYVDWTCMDGYNHGDHPNHPSGWRSFSALFGKTYAQLLKLAPGKPIMIAETASTEVRRRANRPAAKAAWIGRALRVDLPRRFPRVKAVAWFNWNIRSGGRRWDWPIESSAAARRAFAKGISSPYYAHNRFGRLPRHQPVRPLR